LPPLPFSGAGGNTALAQPAEPPDPIEADAGVSSRWLVLAAVAHVDLDTSFPPFPPFAFCAAASSVIIGTTSAVAANIAGIITSIAVIFVFMCNNPTTIYHIYIILRK
jgi:hypothetical protein